MNVYLIIIPLCVIYLFTINYYLKKLNFGLDKVSANEDHKLLLRSNNITPLSGTLFFLPIILVLFYKLESPTIIICLLFFILGFLSDLKILNSYRLRLFFQISFLILLFFFNKELEIYTRLKLIDSLMTSDFFRVIIGTFFFMVLINGFNLIDGTNSLCSLNFLIITIFACLIMNKMNISFINFELSLLIIPLVIFFILNFFGLNFLGDGAAYGIGFFLGYVLVNISLIDQSISPYYIANLLWYPAFENLFCIVRRGLKSSNNYLPDNDHLHHLIFKLLKKKNITKRNFLLSSYVGLIINLILTINYTIGFMYLSNTVVQTVLIVIGVLIYMFVYYNLEKKLD